MRPDPDHEKDAAWLPLTHMLPVNHKTYDAQEELSDKAVARLIKRLLSITDTLDRHYRAQLLRLEPSRCVMHPHRECNCADDLPESDPPF